MLAEGGGGRPAAQLRGGGCGASKQPPAGNRITEAGDRKHSVASWDGRQSNVEAKTGSPVVVMGATATGHPVIVASPNTSPSPSMPRKQPGDTGDGSSTASAASVFSTSSAPSSCLRYASEPPNPSPIVGQYSRHRFSDVVYDEPQPGNLPLSDEQREESFGQSKEQREESFGREIGGQQTKEQFEESFGREITAPPAAADARALKPSESVILKAGPE